MAFVLVRNGGSAAVRSAVPGDLLVGSIDAALERGADLIIEAAVPDVLAELAPRALRRASVCGFSCTALSAIR